MIMGSAEDKITEIFEKRFNEYLEQAEQDLYIVANEVNELYYKQINRMYNSFIKQYYEYPTKSYIRHWEQRPGTKKGSNLYYANNFKIHRGKDPYFEIFFSSSRMADDYQHDSAMQVVQNVMDGIRGVPPYWVRDWRGSYKSRYFKCENVTPTEAFDIFMKELPDMATPVFLRRWHKIRRR